MSDHEDKSKKVSRKSSVSKSDAYDEMSDVLSGKKGKSAPKSEAYDKMSGVLGGKSNPNEVDEGEKIARKVRQAYEDRAKQAKKEQAATAESTEAAAQKAYERRAAKLGAQDAKQEPQSPYLAEHTVVSGDNLSYISRDYYGTTEHWQKIYEANKEIIGDNPSLIRPGQILKIPRLDA